MSVKLEVDKEILWYALRHAVRCSNNDENILSDNVRDSILTNIKNFTQRDLTITKKIIQEELRNCGIGTEGRFDKWLQFINFLDCFN